jgi:hypothetical protein
MERPRVIHVRRFHGPRSNRDGALDAHPRTGRLCHLHGVREPHGEGAGNEKALQKEGFYFSTLR